MVINSKLVTACALGDLSSVKSIVAENGINEETVREAFPETCANGHLEVIRYLLSEHHVDIHMRRDWPFRTACGHSQLEVARYLALSSEITEHADVHAEFDEGFEISCYNENLDMIRFMLFETDILSPELEVWVRENDNFKIQPDVIAMIDSIHEREQLQKDIDQNTTQNKKSNKSKI